MRVRVKVSGYLVYSAGFDEKEFELEDGATVGDLLDSISLGREPPRLVTRQGKAVGPGEPLRDGDRLMVAPFYSGG